jgi:hypothetical protein
MMYMQKYRKIFVKGLLISMLLVSLSVLSVQYAIIATSGWLPQATVLNKQAYAAMVAEQESESETSETEIEIELEDLIGASQHLTLPNQNMDVLLTSGISKPDHYTSHRQQVITPPPQPFTEVFLL